MSYFSSIKLITDYLKLNEISALDFTATYHQVAQTFCKWPVVINDNGLKIQLFEWGLMANYMNSPEKIKQFRSSMANARSKKMLLDKASVWHQLKNQLVFCFAGLYNYSPIPDKETGEMTGTFSILTRPANSLMKKIHNAGKTGNRMPLLLTKELAKKWLSADLSDKEMEAITAFEFPASEMNAWPVHTIRTHKEDDENIIIPLEDVEIPAL